MKGSATAAESVAIMPPLITSILRRDKLLAGIVLDTYFYVTQVGNYYFRHVLAILDSLDSNFTILPLH